MVTDRPVVSASAEGPRQDVLSAEIYNGNLIKAGSGFRSNNLYPSQQYLRCFEKNVSQTDLAPPFHQMLWKTKLTRDKETKGKHQLGKSRPEWVQSEMLGW